MRALYPNCSRSGVLSTLIDRTSLWPAGCTSVCLSVSGVRHSLTFVRIGYDKFIILEPYGPRLREGRKLILNNINTRNAAILHPVQVSKMLLFLRKLFEDSGHLRLHVRW